MVVGEDQTLGAYDLAGASATEDDDSILQRWFVDIIELILGEYQPFFLHIIIYLLAEQ